ncbi:MAG: methyltransferase family protein [Anaerolineales bacterium]
MSVFDWVAASIVITSMLYVTFVLTVPEWMAALRKGQAVTLLPERKGGNWPMWSQIAILFLGLLLCVPLFYYGWVPLLTPPSSMAQILSVLGLTIYIVGMSFMLWARRTLGKNWGLSTSLQAKLRDDHELVRSGPYAFVRHPMYFGAWAFMFGLLLLYPKWVMLVFTVSMLASLSMRARREEIALAERFGDVWVKYKKRTKFIIPFIY